VLPPGYHYTQGLVLVCITWIKGKIFCTGVQKVGTAGTTGAGQTTFGWTKSNLDEEKKLDILWQERRNLTNWTFGSLTSDINTFPNGYLTHCPMNIVHLKPKITLLSRFLQNNNIRALWTN
jgi:hypothetical protein